MLSFQSILGKVHVCESSTETLYIVKDFFIVLATTVSGSETALSEWSWYLIEYRRFVKSFNSNKSVQISLTALENTMQSVLLAMRSKFTSAVEGRWFLLVVFLDFVIYIFPQPNSIKVSVTLTLQNIYYILSLLQKSLHIKQFVRVKRIFHFILLPYNINT